MGQITENFAQTTLSYCEDGKHPPLTVWETKQLVLAWLERESLRQQLEKCEAEFEEYMKAKVTEADELRQQLAESQAREKMLRDAMATVIGNCILGIHNGRPAYHITANAFAVMVDALALPSAPAALDSDIRQAKRDFLLEVANRLGLQFDELERRMADELKPADVEQTNQG